jgi:hypothetical protein
MVLPSSREFNYANETGENVCYLIDKAFSEFEIVQMNIDRRIN